MSCGQSRSRRVRDIRIRVSPASALCDVILWTSTVQQDDHWSARGGDIAYRPHLAGLCSRIGAGTNEKFMLRHVSNVNQPSDPPFMCCSCFRIRYRFQRARSNIHTWHWDGVREPHLRWLVNENHVAGLVPRVRVVDDMSSRVDTTWSLFLE